jgi:Mannosyltransferase (PIG-V)
MFCVGVFLAARIGLSLLGWLGIRDVTHPGDLEVDRRPGVDIVTVPGPVRSPATPGLHNAFDGTDRWDARWFLLIAEQGYVDESAAVFFPGYPLAIRVIDHLTPLASLGAALLVSNVAFLGALVTLYRLSVAEFDEATARRSVVLLTFFPTSFFFLAPYSESMYLLTSLLAFRWARNEHWEMAGLAGAVAWATRSIGATLAPALLLEASRRRPPPARRWIALIALPAIVPIAYLGWWWAQAGDPLVPLATQSEWYREPMFPLVSLGRGLAIGLQALGDALWLPEAGDVLLTIVPLMVLALGWRRLPSPSYTLYAALGFLVPFSLAIPDRPLFSMSRFVIVLFPVAWIAARQMEGRYRYPAVLSVSVLGWIGLSLGFMNWRFVA